MGFQNLRSNNVIYVLHKGLEPKLEIGKVLTVSLPVPKYPGVYNSESIVDITSDVNGTSTNFQKLPAHLDISDVSNNVVVSCNKDLMTQEVQSIKQKSEDIAGCDNILKSLNPEIVEKEKQQLETQALKDEITTLKTMFQDFINNYNKEEK